MTLICILFPWLSFLLRGKILSGIVCAILQISIIGWIPAAIWAVNSRNQAKADKRTDRIVEAIQQSGKYQG